MTKFPTRERPQREQVALSTGRRAHWVALVAVVVSLVGLTSACGQVSSVISGCSSLSDEQQTSLMSHARADFAFGTNRIKDITYVDSASVALPEDLQKYGATRLLVTRIGAFPAGADGSDIPGIQTSALFAADDDEQVVAPVRELAETFFDYPASEQPGWDAYVERVFASDAASTALGCVT